MKVQEIIDKIQEIEGIEHAVVMNYDNTVPFLDLHLSLKEAER